MSPGGRYETSERIRAVKDLSPGLPSTKEQGAISLDLVTNIPFKVRGGELEASFLALGQRLYAVTKPPCWSARPRGVLFAT